MKIINYSLKNYIDSISDSCQYGILFLIVVLLSSCAIWDVEDHEGEFNERTIYFSINVDTSNPNIPTSQPKLEKDLGVLILPKNYSEHTPTKLLIYCHSGGGSVYDNKSEAEENNYVRYLVSLGYAVLDMAGMPKSVSDSLNIDHTRCVGSYIAVRSYIEGFNYVIEHYNIDKEAVFLFANSNGGLVASNLVNLTDLPIKRQAGICPLISIENAWEISSSSFREDGFKAFQNRANIIRLYGMNNIYNQNDLSKAVYDKKYVGIYDPYDYSININKEVYRVPYMIIQTKDDIVVNYKYAQQFALEQNKRGGNVVLQLLESGGHDSEPIKIRVGAYIFENKEYSLTPTVRDVALWFKE